jgi:hypothetical protein
MNGDGTPITCIQGDIKFTSPAAINQPNDFNTFDDIFDFDKYDE